MSIKFTYAVLAAICGCAFQHGFHIGMVNIMKEIVNRYYAEKEKARLAKIYNTPFSNHDSNPELRASNKANKEGEHLVDIAVALYAIGGFFGALLIKVTADGLGRKKTLLITNGLVIIGVFFQCIGLVLSVYTGMTFTMIFFFIGRLFIGIYVGVTSGVCPIYLIEIAPQNFRGVAGSSYNVMVSFGIFVSQIMTLPETTGTFGFFSIAIGLSFIPSILQVLLLLCVPESPKYLYINKEEEEEADEALTWLRESWDVDDEVEEIEEEATVLDELEDVTCGRMFNDQTLRSPLIICLVIMAGHQLCGANALFYYSTAMLETSGFVISARFISLGLAAINLLLTIVSMLLVDVIGRKPLLLVSFAGMTFTTVSIAITAEFQKKNPDAGPGLGYAVLSGMFFFVILFATGAASIPWFITAELHNHNARPLATCIVVSVGWFMHILFAIFFGAIFRVMGFLLFLLYFLANVIVFVFLAFTMRETMDMSALDIIELFYD